MEKLAKYRTLVSLEDDLAGGVCYGTRLCAVQNIPCV